MHFSRTASLGLVLAGLCALGTVTARPASAQNLLFTLSGVTFDDGALATGYFNFNPTTQVFGDYNITTTNGVSDSLTGAHYLPSTDVNTRLASSTFNTTYSFQSASSVGFAPYNFFSVTYGYGSITGPGTYSLQPGTATMNGGFNNSGEAIIRGTDPTKFLSRGVVTGSLSVTSPVPEASTMVSLGLLLALGLGGLVIAARRKRADVEASSAL